MKRYNQNYDNENGQMKKIKNKKTNKQKKNQGNQGTTEVIERVHSTSRRPCWRIKQRNGGHVGGVNQSYYKRMKTLYPRMIFNY